MSVPTQPIRDEHRELLPHVDHLVEAANRVGTIPTTDLRAEVGRALDFLRNHLLIHATAEEQVLYPAVARAAGSPRVTDTMEHEHGVIAGLIDELAAASARLDAGEPDEATLDDIRRLLYGLHTLVAVHFEKEEEIYLPLLDRAMTAVEVTEMYREMEAAAGAARTGG